MSDGISKATRRELVAIAGYLHAAKVERDEVWSEYDRVRKRLYALEERLAAADDKVASYVRQLPEIVTKPAPPAEDE